jgi:hypothetical protein
VVAVLRRQQLQAFAVHVDAIEMTKVRVASLFTADGDEIQLPVLLVDTKQLRHVPVAGRDRVLLAPGLQVVKIQVTPVVALGKPDDLVRRRQIAPVDCAIARLVERLGLLLHHLADDTRGCVGHTHLLAPVIPRGRDECHRGAVRTPLHVAPLAAARHVVAQGRAMLIGRQLQTHDLAAVHVDDDAVDHCHRGVAGQGVLPGLQRRVSDRRVHQVHLADAALILLERGDLPRVGRPAKNRAVAARPARVVGGVAEVLDAVFGERRFAAGGDIADPEIPVANESHAFPVGRRLGVASSARAGARRILALGRLAGRQIAGGFRRLARIHQHGLDPLLRRHPVPEAVGGVSWKPRRSHARMQHQRRGVVGHEFFGVGIIGGGQRGGRARAALRQQASGGEKACGAAASQARDEGHVRMIQPGGAVLEMPQRNGLFFRNAKDSAGRELALEGSAGGQP